MVNNFEKDEKNIIVSISINHFFYRNSNKNYLLILPILIVYNPSDKQDGRKMFKNFNFFRADF
jgi:hypothetical protein